MSHTILPLRAGAEVPPQIQSYLLAVDAALRHAGATELERADVLDNVRTHIAEMLDEHYGTHEVTAAQIDAVIADLDSPESYASSYQSVQPSSAAAAANDAQPVPSSNGNGAAPEAAYADLHFVETRNTRPPGYAMVLCAIFGVLLPAAALFIELAWRIWSAEVFDPIPTWAHSTCVAFVPLAYLLALVGVTRNRVPVPRMLLAATGVATGISFLYMLAFLPTAPFAAVAIIWFGIGLLPLAPLFAFVCGFWLKGSVRLRAGEPPAQRLPGWLFPVSFLAGIALLLLCYVPSYFIYSSIHDAAHGDAAQRRDAIRHLRWFGGEHETLRLAYASRSRSGDVGLGPLGIFWTGGADVPREDARIAYYRLTGRPFNSMPPPSGQRGLFSDRSAFERFPEMRDGTVGWIDPELTLASSRIDSIADAPSATGYVEWTMLFHNATGAQREARSQILLPPGGVVSRLTLWVNGEEREAAFAERGRVKEAYENVVSRRRDPVLVTSSGPDRILVQCFPVPPGGNMKVRIGITHPLPLKDTTEQVQLPRFIERNFDIPEKTQHSVWIEAQGQLNGKLGKRSPTQSDSGKTRLAGQLFENELAAAAPVQLAGIQNVLQFADLRDPEKYAITQTLTETKSEPPQTLVFVVDTSAATAAFREKLAAACRDLPANLKIRLVLASDNPALHGADTDLTVRNLVDEVQNLECAGGQDNIPALSAAWQTAMGLPNSAIVWVHAPQSVRLEEPEALVQLFERAPKAKPAFYEVLLGPGPDRIVGELERYVNIQFVSGIGNDALSELGGLFRTWRDSVPQQQLIRTRREIAAGELPTSATRASGHVSRLWAYAEAVRLMRSDNSAVSQAIDLAVKYQLVTPLTGAVVLENQSQYEQAGLKPVQPASVPTIPEPGEWALIVIAVALLGFALQKYRRQFTGHVAP